MNRTHTQIKLKVYSIYGVVNDRSAQNPNLHFTLYCLQYYNVQPAWSNCTPTGEKKCLTDTTLLVIVAE